MWAIEEGTEAGFHAFDVGHWNCLTTWTKTRILASLCRKHFYQQLSICKVKEKEKEKEKGLIFICFILLICSF